MYNGRVVLVWRWSSSSSAACRRAIQSVLLRTSKVLRVRELEEERVGKIVGRRISSRLCFAVVKLQRGTLRDNCVQQEGTMDSVACFHSFVVLQTRRMTGNSCRRQWYALYNYKRSADDLSKLHQKVLRKRLLAAAIWKILAIPLGAHSSGLTKHVSRQIAQRFEPRFFDYSLERRSQERWIKNIEKNRRPESDYFLCFLGQGDGCPPGEGGFKKGGGLNPNGSQQHH